MGILFQHKFLTSNMTNQTPFWKSLLRLGITYLIVSIFLYQLSLVSWLEGIVKLYFNKTIIPCGFCAFILTGIIDSLFEYLGLLNRSSPNEYCSYIHSSVQIDYDDEDLYRTESLLPRQKHEVNPAINV